VGSDDDVDRKSCPNAATYSGSLFGGRSSPVDRLRKCWRPRQGPASCMLRQRPVPGYVEEEPRSATRSRDTKPSPGSGGVATESPPGRGPTGSFNSCRLSSWTGSRIWCRRRGEDVPLTGLSFGIFRAAARASRLDQPFRSMADGVKVIQSLAEQWRNSSGPSPASGPSRSSPTARSTAYPSGTAPQWAGRSSAPGPRKWSSRSRPTGSGW